MGLSLFHAFAIKMVLKFLVFFFLGKIFKLSWKIEGMDHCREGKFLPFWGGLSSAESGM